VLRDHNEFVYGQKELGNATIVLQNGKHCQILHKFKARVWLSRIIFNFKVSDLPYLHANLLFGQDKCSSDSHPFYRPTPSNPLSEITRLNPPYYDVLV
jgi:hypothetical protein